MLDYEIKKTYEDMELYIINSMKRNLTRHLREEDKLGFKYPQWQAEKLKELKRYQRENKDIIRTYVKGLDKDVSEYLKEELKQGSLKTLKKYKEIMGDKYKANKRVNKSFFRTNDRKVTALINSVNNDLKKGNSAVLRLTNDQYRQAIFKSQLYVSNGVLTPKQAQDIAVRDIKKAKELEEYKLTTLGVDKANKDFLRGGLNSIVYKNGRRVNIASYAQMAIRTAGQRAHLMGEGKFRQGYGYHLVKVTTHGTSCPLCQEWQGKVLIDDVYGGGSKKDGKYPLLSDAMAQGFLHPNCKHGLTTYFPEIEDIEKSFENGKDGSESDAAYQEDMNYINRKIKEYTRLEQGSIDPENITTYKDKRVEWEGKKTTLKKNTKGNPLTPEEKSAVEHYVSGEGMWINQYLRGKGDFGELSTMEKSYLNDLNNATSKPLAENMTLYRSVDANAIFSDMDVLEFEDFKNDLMYGASDKGQYAQARYMKHKELADSVKGRTILEQGFMSTTKSYDVAIDFDDFTGSNKPIVLEIDVPKGTKGIDLEKEMKELNDRMEQNEVLLNKGVEYQIEEITTKDGHIYVKTKILKK